jgi:hypothetical protein
VLRAQGKDTSLLHSLLNDAERWTEFQYFLQTEGDCILMFFQEYNQRHNKVMCDKVPEKRQEFLNILTAKINQLDETSRILIQLVSNEGFSKVSSD